MALHRINAGPRMSGAVVHAGTVYLSGQVDPSGGDVTAQTTNILAKIDGLLREAGTDRSRIISASIWLADIATFDEMNAVWDAWVTPGAAPARATVEAKLAQSHYRVEIAMIAATR